MAARYSTPSVRSESGGLVIRLKGALQALSEKTAGSTLATISQKAFRPQVSEWIVPSFILIPNTSIYLTISETGAIAASVTLTNEQVLYLTGITFTLS